MNALRLVAVLLAVASMALAPRALEGMVASQKLHRQPSAPAFAVDDCDIRASESCAGDTRGNSVPDPVGPGGPRVEGVVHTHGNQPIAGARAYLVPCKSWTVSSTSVHRLGAYALSDAEGRFAIEADKVLIAESLDFVVEADGYEPRCMEYGRWNARESHAIQLDRGVAITGHVLDEEGRGIGNVAVWATARGIDENVVLDRDTLRTRYSLHCARTMTAANGSFVIGGLTTGLRYRVRMSRQGYMAANVPIRSVDTSLASDWSVIAPCRGLELRVAPLFLARVQVRMGQHDYTRAARHLLEFQGLQLPKGVAPVWVPERAGNYWFPTELRTELSADESVRSGLVRLVAAQGVPGGGGELRCSLRWPSLLGLERSRDQTLRLYRDGETECAVTQVVELRVPTSVSVGQIRIARSDGGKWPAPTIPVWVRARTDKRGDGAIIDAIRDATHRELLTPPIPQGEYELRVIGYGDSSGGADTVTVRSELTTVTSIAARQERSVFVRAEYGSGLPATCLEMAVLRGSQVIRKLPWPTAFECGEELLKVSDFSDCGELEILVTRPGFPVGRLAVRGVPESSALVVRFPGCPVSGEDDN